MLKKILISLWLVYACALVADNGWSTPVALSTPDVIPFANPHIVSDNNNTLYAFWPRYYNNIQYRASNDGGASWSNIDSTSSSLQDQPTDPAIVADNQNNLHLFFHYLNSSKVLYQKRFNGQWTEPVIISNYATNLLRAVIDKNDNIYVSWLIGSTPYQTLYRIIRADGCITPIKLLSDKLYSPDMYYDGDNGIHIAGKSNMPPLANSIAYYAKYDIAADTVVTITDISSGLQPTGTRGITDKNGVPFTVVGYDSSPAINTSCYTGFTSSGWLTLQQVKRKTDPNDKQIVVDGNNQPHVFDVSEGQLDTLFHHFQTPLGWQTEIISCDPVDGVYWINGFKTLVVGDQLYLIYKWAKNGGWGSKIMFTKKTIPVSIETTTPSKAVDLELSSYPNPFNSNTKISFNLPTISSVKLEIFNAKGELVQQLVSSRLKSGDYSYSFDATGLNSGVYYCRLSANERVTTTKLMLLK